MFEKYPTKVPIILEPQNLILDHKKYLVEKTVTLGQFSALVRSKNPIKSSQSIIFFVNNILPTNTQLISELHNTYKKEDGILYITLRPENVFG